MQRNHDGVRVPVGDEPGKEVAFRVDEPHGVGIDAQAPPQGHGSGDAPLEPVGSSGWLGAE